MVPGSRSLVSDDGIEQTTSHLDDSVCHRLELDLPLLLDQVVIETATAITLQRSLKIYLIKLWSRQDGCCHASTVNRWARVDRTHDDLDLTENTLGFLLGLAHDVERTHTLSVETHVLGERLRYQDLESLSNEVSGEGKRGWRFQRRHHHSSKQCLSLPHSISVFFERARSEA